MLHGDINFHIPKLLMTKPTKVCTHNLITRWEDVHCRLSMDNLPSDLILSHIDFADNNNFEMQTEIQSMH
jgi:hypothetical protein